MSSHVPGPGVALILTVYDGVMDMIIAFVLAATLGMVGQDREQVLDLTRTPELMDPRILEHNIQNCRAGGRGAGQSGGSPPFVIAIESVDKAEYAMGGQIIVHMRLTNTSTRPLPVPTVFLDQFVDPFEGEDAVQFGFGIVLRDVNGQEHDISGTALRGSTKIPYTTQTLDPGKSMKIRFPGYIVITDGPTAPPTGEAQLFASLVINDGECRGWNPVKSNLVAGLRFIGR
jgi:hypothetical protein